MVLTKGKPLFEHAKMITQAREIYRGLLGRRTFLDEQDAAAVLCNLANCYRLSPANYQLGMSYYVAAREILGETPLVRDGIEWFSKRLLQNRDGRD